MRWMTMGEVLVVLMCAIGVGEADARTRRRWVCEEWRDYIYNAETGAFIAWSGEPYWFCHFDDDPVTYPDSPDPDRYGGGVGRAQDPRVSHCRECMRQHDRCVSRVQRGSERCMRHYRKLYRGWCARQRRQRFGRPLEGSYVCEPVDDVGDENRGRGGPGRRHRMECTGPAIDACVASFERDYPGTSVEDTVSLELGPDWFGTGDRGTVSVSWGGSMGFAEACRVAGDQASLTCLHEVNECEETVGGCP